MSKIKLTGENSGYVEISAGQNAGNNTLEAPTSGTRLVAHEGTQDVVLGGNLTVNGVLTYEDVTNIDSVGVITARSGIHVTGGNVGIGTDNPDIYGYGGKLLTVSDSSTYTNLILASSDASNSGISFGGQTLRRAQIQGGNGSDSDLIFLTNSSNSGVFVTEKVRIKSDGNVGIGTSNPPWPLSVTGTVSGGTVSSGAGIFVGVQDNFAVMQMNTASDANGCIIDMGYSGQDYKGRILYDNSSDYMSLSTNNGERFRIDSVGRITTPNQPSFFSRPPASYNLSVGGNIIGGTWADVHNVGSHFSNGTFLAPVAGTYQFTWCCFNQSEGVRQDAYILVNGTEIMREEINGYNSAFNRSASVHGSYYLSANDSVTFGVHSQAGTNTYVSQNPWGYACGYLVG